MTFFDTNIILDIVADDPTWADWSAQAIVNAGSPRRIAPVVFAELSAGFVTIAELERELTLMELTVEEPTPDALFHAGQAHASYRRSGGPRERVLPDFLIGAQATDRRSALVTRDARRYRAAFPTLMLIAP